jgi:hypothetical protein
MNKSNWLAASIAAGLMLACSSQKAPAEQAVADIDTALSAIHDSAAKYSPDTLQTVEAQIATLHKSLDQADYKGVLASAPAVNTAVASLKQDTEVKQAAVDAALAQTKQQWITLGEEVSKLLTGIHSQLDMLSNKRRLPTGVTKTLLESAKAEAASLNSMWQEATNTLAKDDNYASAVAKGQAVKDKASQLMLTLGSKPS